MTNQDEIRVVNNFLNHMSNAYRKRTKNFTVVGDILLSGTRTSGMTSCVGKCIELNIDPYSYDINQPYKVDELPWDTKYYK